MHSHNNTTFAKCASEILGPHAHAHVCTYIGMYCVHGKIENQFTTHIHRCRHRHTHNIHTHNIHTHTHTQHNIHTHNTHTHTHTHTHLILVTKTTSFVVL